MKRLRINAMWYPRPVWFLIPTIEYTNFRRYIPIGGMTQWTIDLRWLRFMITIAKIKQ